MGVDHRLGEDPNPELPGAYEDQRPEDIFEVLNPDRRVIKCPMCSSPETSMRRVEFPSAGLYMEISDSLRWEVRPMESGPNPEEEDTVMIISECWNYRRAADAKHRWAQILRWESAGAADFHLQTTEIVILS